jgi:hypothetical protein
VDATVTTEQSASAAIKDDELDAQMHQDEAIRATFDLVERQQARKLRRRPRVELVNALQEDIAVCAPERDTSMEKYMRKMGFAIQPATADGRIVTTWSVDEFDLRMTFTADAEEDDDELELERERELERQQQLQQLQQPQQHGNLLTGDEDYDPLQLLADLEQAEKDGELPDDGKAMLTELRELAEKEGHESPAAFLTEAAAQEQAQTQAAAAAAAAGEDVQQEASEEQEADEPDEDDQEEEEEVEEQEQRRHVLLRVPNTSKKNHVLNLYCLAVNDAPLEILSMNFSADFITELGDDASSSSSSGASSMSPEEEYLATHANSEEMMHVQQQADDLQPHDMSPETCDALFRFLRTLGVTRRTGLFVTRYGSMVHQQRHTERLRALQSFLR